MTIRRLRLPLTLACIAAGIPSICQSASEFRLSVDETTPPVKRGGPLTAKVITNEQELMPGLIADGNLGDLILKNDFVQAIFVHPNRKNRLNGGGGALVDVTFREFPQDALDYIQTTADTGTSAGVVKYTKVDRIEVSGDSTATLALSGTANPVQGEPTLDVTTTYELPRDEAHLVVTTTYRNPSTDRSASLIPGDIVDWGIMTGFAEGNGITQRLSVLSSRVIAGLSEETTLGFVHPDGAQLKAVTAPRIAVLQYWGVPKLPEGADQALEPATALSTGRPALEPAASSSASKDAEQGNVPTLMGPGGRVLLPPTTINPLTLPGSETNYAPAPNGLRKTETPYGMVMPDSRTGVWAESLARSWSAESPGGAESRPVTNSPDRLVLQPGQSFTVKRLIAPSSRDLGRITNLASRLQAAKQPKSVGAIAGVVLDSESAAPLSGADIFVSGGPEFQGVGTPAPVIRGTTRADGTFGLRLPHGRYLVQATLNGRQALAGPSLVTLSTTSPLVTVPIGMSKESRVNLTVTKAGSEELSPAKVTLVPKPGSVVPWFGSSTNVTSGSRNVQFLPRGRAEFPVTPGRYEMTISRGPEYDIVRGELTVAPGATQNVSVALEHSLAPHVQGMVSMDAGVLTNASASGTLDAESRIIQAVCEGVSVIVSGDYSGATDLSATIAKLGFQNLVKSFMGRRWLLSGDGMTIDLLAYPLTPEINKGMEELVAKEREAGTPPDVILSDLRRKFPQVILQIDRAADPDKGYLNSFEFDERRLVYSESSAPPPDFDALQVVDGKRVAVQEYLWPRYSALAAQRARDGQPFLAAMANSNSRVGAAEEVGSSRAYLLTPRDTLDRFDADALTTAIRTGRYILSNGPLLNLVAMDPKTGNFSMRVGDMMNALTTQTAVVRPMVYAAPWVGMNSITVYMDGVISDRTEVMPSIRPLRYPVQANQDSANKVRYLESDTMITAGCLGIRRPLSPVLSPLPDILGGAPIPFSISGPILVDYNADGKIQPKLKEEVLGQSQQN